MPDVLDPAAYREAVEARLAVLPPEQQEEYRRRFVKLGVLPAPKEGALKEGYQGLMGSLVQAGRGIAGTMLEAGVPGGAAADRAARNLESRTHQYDPYEGYTPLESFTDLPTFARTAGQAAGTTLGSALGSAAGAAVGGVPGAIAGSTAVIFGQTYGKTLEDYRKTMPDTPEADIKALAFWSSAVQSALEGAMGPEALISKGFAKAFGKEVGEKAIAAGWKPLAKEVAKGAAKGVPKAGLTEGTEEVMQGATDELARIVGKANDDPRILDFRKRMEEFVGGVAGGMVFGAYGGAMEGTGNYVEGRRRAQYLEEKRAREAAAAQLDRQGPQAAQPPAAAPVPQAAPQEVPAMGTQQPVPASPQGRAPAAVPQEQAPAPQAPQQAPPPAAVPQAPPTPPIRAVADALEHPLSETSDVLNKGIIDAVSQTGDLPAPPAPQVGPRLVTRRPRTPEQIAAETPPAQDAGTDLATPLHLTIRGRRLTQESSAEQAPDAGPAAPDAYQTEIENRQQGPFAKGARVRHKGTGRAGRVVALSGSEAYVNVEWDDNEGSGFNPAANLEPEPQAAPPPQREIVVDNPPPGGWTEADRVPEGERLSKAQQARKLRKQMREAEEKAKADQTPAPTYGGDAAADLAALNTLRSRLMASTDAAEQDGLKAEALRLKQAWPEWTASEWSDAFPTWLEQKTLRGDDSPAGTVVETPDGRIKARKRDGEWTYAGGRNDGKPIGSQTDVDALNKALADYRQQQKAPADQAKRPEQSTPTQQPEAPSPTPAYQPPARISVMRYMLDRLKAAGQNLAGVEEAYRAYESGVGLEKEPPFDDTMQMLEGMMKRQRVAEETPKQPEEATPPAADQAQAQPADAEPAKGLRAEDIELDEELSQAFGDLAAALTKQSFAMTPENQAEQLSEILHAGTKIARLLVRKGVREFKQFARTARKFLPQLWEQAKPYLHSMWSAAVSEQPPAVQAACDDLTRRQADAEIAAIEAETPPAGVYGKGEGQQGDTGHESGSRAPAKREPVLEAPGMAQGGAPERAGGVAGEGDAAPAPGQPDQRGADSATDAAGGGDAQDGRGGRGAQDGGPGRPADGTADTADEAPGGEAGGVRAEPGGVADTPANYRFAPDQQLVRNGEKTRVKDNLAAIRLLHALEREEREATAAEKAILARYCGWGGLKNALDELRLNGLLQYEQDQNPYNRLYDEKWAKAWGKEAKALREALTDAEWKDAAASIRNAHYTSRPVIETMWKMAQRLGFKGGKVGEFGAGIGHFLGLMPEALSSATDFMAVERDSLSARIMAKLYPRADVHAKSLETTRIANNSLSMVIGNFPFDKIKPYDPNYPPMMLHNYFFARALDAVAPGGLVVVVTSASTLDSSDSIEARRYIGQRAWLVGAVRLTNETFADNANTEVVTDILILQKRGTGLKPHLNDWMLALPMATQNRGARENGEINVNEYYHARPEMLTGVPSNEGKLYGGAHDESGQPTFNPKKDTDEAQELERVTALLPANVVEGVELSTEKVQEAGEGQREFSYVLDAAGGLKQVQGGVLVEPSWAREKAKAARARSYIAFRDTLLRLITGEVSGDLSDAELEALRGTLNKLHDEHVRRFSTKATKAYFGEPSLHRFLNDDPDIFKVLDAEEERQEVVTNKKGVKKILYTYGKGPIFTARVNYPWAPPASASSLTDAVALSESLRNGIDVPYIAELLKRPAAEIEAELAAGAAFRDPQTGIWQSRGEYLSGNLRDKLAAAERAAVDDQAYAANVEALKAAMPAQVELKSISMSFGARWIPDAVMTGFLRHIMGMDIGAKREGKSQSWVLDRRIRYEHGQAPAFDKYSVTIEEQDAAGKPILDADGKPVMTTRANAWLVLSNGLKGRAAIIYDHWTDADGHEHSRKNPRATFAAAQAYQQLTEDFAAWVKADPEMAKQVEDEYNRVANSSATVDIEVSATTKYPGMVEFMTEAGKPYVPQEHQHRGIRRILRGSTMLAHGVGTGKTGVLTIAAMELKRLGLARKTMIVVHNATLEQYAKFVPKAYPTARVLLAGKDDLQKKNRRRFLSRIALNDWDIIVMAHSSFDLIPNKPERVEAYIDAELQEIKDALERAITEEGKDSPKVRDLQGKLTSAENSLRKLLNRDTDDTVFWEDLGVDALFVDEAHKYKKLHFMTEMNRVKGLDLGAAKGPSSLFLKCEHIRERTGGRNIVMATGTPVTNTLAELWTMMRYVRPDVLAQWGVPTFDQFAQMFAEIRPGHETDAAGRMKIVDRFAYYKNLHQLAVLWQQCADVVFAEDLPYLERPDRKGGGADLIEIEPSPVLEKVCKYLLDLYEWFENLEGGDKRLFTYIPIKIFGLARKATIDVRLIDPRLPDDPGSKLNRAADEITRKYHQYAEDKGAQVAFLDTYRHYKTRVVGWKLDRDGSVVPKIEETEDFNAWAELKRKVVARGVPESEVAVVSEYKSEANRQMLYDMVNEGTIRVVIGSTETLGTGVNMHRRLAVLHHIDAPYRPSDMEQRIGRALRQGNLFAEIEEKRYGVRRTLDAGMYDMLTRKANMIRDGMTGRGGQTAEEYEEGSLSFAEASAAFSGDKRRMEYVALGMRLRELEAQEVQYKGNLARLNYRLQQDRDSISRANLEVPALQKLREQLAEAFGTPGFTAESADGKAKFQALDRKEAGKRLERWIEGLLKKAGEGDAKYEHQTTLKLNGMLFVVDVAGVTRKFEDGSTRRNTAIRTTLEGHPYLWESRAEHGHTLLQAVGEISEAVEAARAAQEASIANATVDERKVREELAKPFDKAGELEDVSKRHAQLEKELPATDASTGAAQHSDAHRAPVLGDYLDLSKMDADTDDVEGVELPEMVPGGRIRGDYEIAAEDEYYIVPSAETDDVARPVLVRGFRIEIPGKALDIFAYRNSRTKSWDAADGLTGWVFLRGRPTREAVLGVLTTYWGSEAGPYAASKGAALTEQFDAMTQAALEKSGATPRYKLTAEAQKRIEAEEAAKNAALAAGRSAREGFIALGKEAQGRAPLRARVLGRLERLEREQQEALEAASPLQLKHPEEVQPRSVQDKLDAMWGEQQRLERQISHAKDRLYGASELSEEEQASLTREIDTAEAAYDRLEKQQDVTARWRERMERRLQRIEAARYKATREGREFPAGMTPNRRGGMYRTAEGTAAPLETLSRRGMAEARAWWRRAFGSDADLHEVAKLLKGDGKEALGRWTGQWAEIVKGQANPLDTAMHEAVHKALELFLTPLERVRLLRAAGGSEERMAEGIIQYARDGQGFVGQVRMIVDKLLRVLKRYFGTMEKADLVNDFYDRIMRGEFALAQADAEAGSRLGSPAASFRSMLGSHSESPGPEMPEREASDRLYRGESRRSLWESTGLIALPPVAWLKEGVGIIVGTAERREAAQMWEAGTATLQEIMEKTGLQPMWGPRSSDTQVRFATEASDADAKLLPATWGTARTLGELADMPAIYAAYPSIQSIPIRWSQRKVWQIGDGRLDLPLDRPEASDQDILGGLIHEAQHAIAIIERWPVGTTQQPFWLPGMPRPSARDYEDAREQYVRHPGERMAYETEARQPMDAASRRLLPPSSVPAAPSGTDEAEASTDIRYRMRRVPRSARTVADLVAAAESMEDWRDWYERHKDVIRRLFDEDADLFHDILSATSQVQGVKGNVTLALRAYRQLKTGRPLRGYMGAVTKNLQRIRDNLEMQGQKIEQFQRANAGDPDAIAVDRHISRLLFNRPNPTRRQVVVAKRYIQKAAAELGWAPREVQAALWAFRQVEAGIDPEDVQSYDKVLEARSDEIRELREWVAPEDPGGPGGGVPAGRATGEEAQGVEEGPAAAARDEGPVKYRTAEQAAEQEETEAGVRSWLHDFWQTRKIRDKHARPDLTKADRLLTTIAHYSAKVPALRLMYEAALRMTDRKHLLGEQVFGPGEHLVADLRQYASKNREQWEGVVQPYLWQQDRDAKGPWVKETDAGWEVHNEAGEVRAVLPTEREAWIAAHLTEVQDLEADGWSKAAAEAVFNVRRINDNAWEMLADDARQVEAECKALGIPVPPVVMRDGTSINLSQALREMGDRRGHYMPRLRKPGFYQLFATKDGESPIRRHFDTPIGRDIEATTLRRDGYEVEYDTSDNPSEEVYLDASAAAVEQLVNIGLRKLGSDVNLAKWKDFGLEGEWTTYHRKTDDRDEPLFVLRGEYNAAHNEVFKDFGGYWDKEDRAWHFHAIGEDVARSMMRAMLHVWYGRMLPTEAFARAMAQTMAEVLHSRGSQARKIARGEAKGKEVWLGYEEDALKAISMAGKATAAGAAKREMIRDMMAAFTGRDETWQEFKARRLPEIEAEREDEDADEEYDPTKDRQQLWLEYDEQVQQRRIDGAKQPEAYKEGIAYMREMSRNEEPAERVVGVIKGIASLKYLSGLAPAAVNLTALTTTVPAALHGYAHIAMTRVPALLARGLSRYGTHYLHRKFGKGGGLTSADDAWLFDEISKRGWDEQQMNREAIGVLQNWGEAHLAWLTEKALLPFAVTERFNRAATIAAAYWGLVEKHDGDLTLDDRERYLKQAKLVSDKAHGVYGKANMPAWARGSDWGPQLARSWYMYKTFSHNFLTILYELGAEKRDMAAVLTLMLAPAMIGGIGALPLKDVLKGILKALLAAIPGYDEPDDPEEAIYDAAEAAFGRAGEIAARAGLGGLAGVDLRGSLAIGVTDVPTTVSDLLGAPWSVMRDLGGGVSDIAHGDLLKGTEKLLPRIVAGPVRATREATQGVTTRGNQPVYYGDERLRANLVDWAIRFAGFNPARLSTAREEQWNERAVAQDYDSTRSDIYRRVRAYYIEDAYTRDPAEWADVLARVEEYNARVARNNATAPYITAATLRRIATVAGRPSKQEAARDADEAPAAAPLLPAEPPEPAAGGLMEEVDRSRSVRRSRAARSAR